MVSEVKIIKKTGQLGSSDNQPDGLHVKIGSALSGNYNELNFFDDVTSLQEMHTGGPLVESTAFCLTSKTGNNSGRPVGCVRIKTSTVGAISAVTKKAIDSSTGTITVALTSGSASPTDAYNIVFLFTRDGTTGTAAFKYSLDNGVTYGPEIAVPGGGTYDLPNTGLTVTFVPGMGTVYFQTGDLHSFETTAPSPTAQDLADAIAALVADERTWKFWHLVGPPAPANSAVTATGTTPPTITLTGTPTDYYQFRVEVTTGGTLTTAVIKYSTDDGKTFTTNVTSAATVALGTTGVTLNMASGTYNVDNVYVFDSANAAGLATNAALAQTHCNTLNTANRFVFAVIEAPDATDAQLSAAIASTVAGDVVGCAGFDLILSPISFQEDKRSVAWPFVSRIAATEFHIDPGEFDQGAVDGVEAILRDERKTPNLETARLTTMRTFVGEPGFFITSGKTLAPAGSDVSEIPNLRVLNEACRLSYKASLKYLRKRILVDKVTGKILETEARKIEDFLANAIIAGLVTPGKASGVVVTVNRTDNILSTKKLRWTVSVIPLAYANQIENTVGLMNPAIQTV